MSRSLRPRTDRSSLERTVLVGAACEALALAVAAALAPWHGTIPTEDVAIVLFGIVVMAGSLGGRVPAVGTAIVAGLALNFFHTRPYGMVKIDDVRDQITFALLLSSGAFVAAFVTYRERRYADTVGGVDDERLTELALDASADLPMAVIVERALCEIRRCLGAADTWIEAGGGMSASEALPVLDALGVHGLHRHRWRNGGFTLPESGVQIAVGALPGAPRVVVRGDAERPVSQAQRRHAVAVAAVVALALAANPADPVARRLVAHGDAA